MITAERGLAHARLFVFKTMDKMKQPQIDRSRIIFEDSSWQYLERPDSFGHLRCYLGGDDGRTPVIIVTELDDNPGRSVTNSIEDIAQLVEASVLPYLTMLSDQQRKAYILAEEYRHLNDPWTLDQVTFPIPTGVVTRSGGSPRWMPTTYDKLGLALKPNDLAPAMSENIVIVTETEEPGAFDKTSNSVVITVDRSWLAAKVKKAKAVAGDMDDFSELRLFNEIAEYRHLSVDEVINYLLEVSEDDSDSRVSSEDMTLIEDTLVDKNYFVWPTSVDLDFLKISDDLERTAPLDCDIHELILGETTFRVSCYYGDQECNSAWIPYDALGI